LRFSLSHSGALAAYVLAEHREVGIDIEASDPRRAFGRNEIALARRVLGRRLAGQLEALAPPRRSAAFLRAWTSHEAAVKCLGTGLLGAPLQDGELSRGGIWVMELPPVDGAFAALAVEGGPVGVSCRRWEG
jgi:phosphopantetheinyl transferase